MSPTDACDNVEFCKIVNSIVLKKCLRSAIKEGIEVARVKVI